MASNTSIRRIPTSRAQTRPAPGQGGEPKIRTFPTDTRRVRSTPGTWLLLIAATVMVGTGLAVAVGVDSVPGLRWYAERLAQMGISSGSLLISGIVLLGITLVSRYMRVHTATLLTPGATEEALAEVGADMAEFRNKLYEFQNDHMHFRTEIESIRREVQEHRRADASGEAKDALFGLAASLDTLHAKLDQTVSRACDGLARSISELGELVEASRDFLQESVEDAGRQTERLAGDLRDVSADVRALARFGMAPPDAARSSPADADEDEGAQEADAWAEHDAGDGEEHDGLGLLDEMEGTTGADDSAEEWTGYEALSLFDEADEADDRAEHEGEHRAEHDDVAMPAVSYREAEPALRPLTLPLDGVAPVREPSSTAAEPAAHAPAPQTLRLPEMAPLPPGVPPETVREQLTGGRSGEPTIVNLEDPPAPIPAPPAALPQQSRPEEMEWTLRNGGHDHSGDGSAEG